MSIPLRKSGLFAFDLHFDNAEWVYAAFSLAVARVAVKNSFVQNEKKVDSFSKTVHFPWYVFLLLSCHDVMDGGRYPVEHINDLIDADIVFVLRPPLKDPELPGHGEFVKNGELRFGEV